MSLEMGTPHFGLGQYLQQCFKNNLLKISSACLFLFITYRIWSIAFSLPSGLTLSINKSTLFNKQRLKGWKWSRQSRQNLKSQKVH
jgi:hypothetical protein